MDKYDEIIELLRSQNIEHRENSEQLQLRCLFNGCDDNKPLNAARLYINKQNGTYYCQKCGEKGNLVTLKRHFGVMPAAKSARPMTTDPNKLAAKYHAALPDNIRDYLRTERLLSDEIIEDYQLGYLERRDGSWITIPVTDSAGSVLFMKLREDPYKEVEGPDKYKSTGGAGNIFNVRTLRDKPDKLVICEGEFDCLVLQRQGVHAICSTLGAATFKDEWIERLDFVREFYVLMDNDDKGREGADKLIAKLATAYPNSSILRVTLPAELGDKGDVTDFFGKQISSADDLFDPNGKYTQLVAGIKPVDIGQFSEITLEEVAETLSLTIKEDHDNKLITFLCMLSAYTDNSQLNISFNSQSSTGKSYTAIQVASLFPKADKIERGNASPTAFLYGEGTYDKDRNAKLVSLERKILLFYEQPNPQLQEKLRPVLSHDEREITFSVTNRDKKGTNKTEDIVVRGFAATVVCSAGLRLDEQETTRAILLSSDVTDEKIREAIRFQAERGADEAKFNAWLESQPERIALKDRILAIRQAYVMDIIVPEPEEIVRRFHERFIKLKPRNMRDMEHLMQLIKAVTLLNVWFRKQNGKIVASKEDINQAFELWGRFIESQNWNVSPAVMDIYKKYILPAYNEKLKEADPETREMMINGLVGVTTKEVIDFSQSVDSYPLNDEQFRKQVLVQLRGSGMIGHEKPKVDSKTIDKRSPHIFPRYLPPEIKDPAQENNVGTPSGVELSDEIRKLFFGG